MWQRGTEILPPLQCTDYLKCEAGAAESQSRLKSELVGGYRFGWSGRRGVGACIFSPTSLRPESPTTSWQKSIFPSERIALRPGTWKYGLLYRVSCPENGPSSVQQFFSSRLLRLILCVTITNTGSSEC